MAKQFSNEAVRSAIRSNDESVLKNVTKAQLMAVMSEMMQGQFELNTTTEVEVETTTAMIGHISLVFSDVIGRTSKGKLPIFAPANDDMCQIFAFICGKRDVESAPYVGAYNRTSRYANSFFNSLRVQGQRTGGFTKTQWLEVTEKMFREVTVNQVQFLANNGIFNAPKYAWEFERMMQTREARQARR